MEATSKIAIEKPKVDLCEYHYFELENGLACLVVSDPGTDKAAASMDVSTKLQEKFVLYSSHGCKRVAGSKLLRTSSVRCSGDCWREHALNGLEA